MPDAKRVLNITKRFDLSSLGDAWSDCYVLYRPMTIDDLIQIDSMKVEGISEAESMKLVKDYIKERIVSGKVSLGAPESPQTSDLIPDDIDSFPYEAVTSLFEDMSGASLDPKDTPNQVSGESAPTPVEPSTETSSSTTITLEPIPASSKS